jgi:diaminopimelate decarboxylase
MNWLSVTRARELAAQHGTPLFVYSREWLLARAGELLSLELPFGHVVRYAVKANPHPEIIRLFDGAGLEFDASSSYEASELLAQGIAGVKISLSSQQSAHNLPELLAAGVHYAATSLHQLELFARVAGPGNEVALRVNPDIDGGGHNRRTSTSGVASAFGLWHEYLGQALKLAKSKRLVISRLHMHIGSGADPAVWGRAMDSALAIVRQMPEVTTLNIGGGYKVARVDSEAEADMGEIGRVFVGRLSAFAKATGRKLQLELEPGTWFVAHAGVLLSRVDDIVDTGAGGYNFLRLDTGMNDIIRPAMYGAQHRIEVLNNASKSENYLVVGHNCETGDILTPAPGDPEHIAPRRMHKAEIGDLVMIADTGAYCASFSTKGYNGFPAAKEILI